VLTRPNSYRLWAQSCSTEDPGEDSGAEDRRPPEELELLIQG